MRIHACSCSNNMQKCCALKPARVVFDLDLFVPVQVVTGNLRGAGTVAPAHIQLVGTNGSTERFALGDTDSELFTRGSSHCFDIPVPKV